MYNITDATMLRNQIHYLFIQGNKLYLCKTDYKTQLVKQFKRNPTINVFMALDSVHGVYMEF